MKKTTSILAMVIIFLFAVSVFAKDRYIVVPLGSTKTLSVMKWLGDWALEISYKEGQTVQFEGSSYVCITSHYSDANNSPPGPSHWSLLAAKGDQGDTGTQGPAGADGIDGVNGETGPAGSAGADGIDGVAGATGPAGVDGTDGVNGETGPAGPAGADGTGSGNIDIPSWHRILPVNERFVAVMNLEAILDKETGLVWELSPSNGSYPWYTAFDYCANLENGGRKGWLMPTANQLASLLDTTQEDPALPLGHPFDMDCEVGGCITTTGLYWTSTARVANGTSSTGQNMSVDLVQGEVGNNSGKPFPDKVWCVRSSSVNRVD